MRKALVAYATKYGQTEKIAEFVASDLRLKGLSVDILDMSSATMPAAKVTGYDLAIIGAPVYAGKFPKLAIKWTRDRVAHLNAMPTAFFTVSMNAADKRPEARAADERMLRDFTGRTGLTPKVATPLIGAIHYRKYGPILRWIMKRISTSAGGPTDTSKDHEMTDWNAVAAFVQAALGEEPAPTLASQPKTPAQAKLM